MAETYSDPILEGKSPQYAYALAILSGGIAFVISQLGDPLVACLSYVLLAALFAFMWPANAWQWAGWLCLPIIVLLLFDLFITGSLNRIQINGLIFAKAFLFAAIGIYPGSKLSMRTLNRTGSANGRRKRPGNLIKAAQPHTTGAKKRAAIPVAIRKPVFSTTRSNGHPSALESATTSLNLDAALIKAAQEGDLDKMALLAAQGANLNARSSDQSTPVMIAALDGDVEMVKTLFGNGAMSDAVGDKGWTALMIATVEGHLEVARALVEHGADVNVTDGKGWTALRYAVSMGEMEILRLLLSARADVNQVDAEGRTALMQAAGEESLESLKALLGAGANPHVKDMNGQTALMIARQLGHSGSVKLLKESAAKAYTRVDSEGQVAGDEDSFLYLLKEELEEKLNYHPAPHANSADDAVTLLRSALQTVQEQIDANRRERLLTPSEISHKLMLTLREASTLCGLPRQHLLEAIEERKLKAQFIKHGWRIKRASLDDYIRSLSA
jgi:excisionase family DNA binding protein